MELIEGWQFRKLLGQLEMIDGPVRNVFFGRSISVEISK